MCVLHKWKTNMQAIDSMIIGLIIGFEFLVFELKYCMIRANICFLFLF